MVPNRMASYISMIKLYEKTNILLKKSIDELLGIYVMYSLDVNRVEDTFTPPESDVIGRLRHKAQKVEKLVALIQEMKCFRDDLYCSCTPISDNCTYCSLEQDFQDWIEHYEN